MAIFFGHIFGQTRRSAPTESRIEYLAKAVNQVGEFPVHNKKFKLKKVAVAVEE
ncbi:MAG TPA: hypothetical protein VK469_10395 [Candidatus Kapabacteria bacterium]|nr:hypothetical protein [Candidatus Kapabacteria bacterium]